MINTSSYTCSEHLKSSLIRWKDALYGVKKMTDEQRYEQGNVKSKLCEEYPMEEKLFFSADWQEIWLLVAEMREDILFIVHG